MKNLAALIIEDDVDEALYLVEHLKSVPVFLSVKVVNSPQEGIIELMANRYDLLFLDIKMPSINGLELLSSLILPPTIITSSHPSYAVDCFDIDTVIDFIEKPVSLTRLTRAIRRAQEVICPPKESDYLYFKTGHRNQQFLISDVLYIEADGIYCKVATKNGGKHIVNDNISEIEKKLQHTPLLRLHKSYIYNCNYITSFDSRHLWIGNQKFALGVNYRGKLGELLNIEPNS